MGAASESLVRLPAGALESFMIDALSACGLARSEAAIVAGAMLDADLSGSDAHGIFRLPGYVRIIKRGHINVRPDIALIERAGATALIDGDNGMGHLVMTHAAELAVEIARECGLAWVGVRRSNHAGAAATYAAIPLAHGMIGIYSAVSGSNFMAPWGGAEPRLGTNPIAVAIPAGKEAPVVLDIATSVVSNGAIRAYVLEGKPMPEGWVMSRQDGSPITDGRRLSEGMFVPIGGYKGSGLALALGLLAGPLNRAAFGRDIRDINTEQARETNTGQFVIALDVARFLPPEQFAAAVDRHVRDLAASQRLPGVAEIRIPGQGRQARRADRQKNGVPLSPTLIKQLDELATALAIAPIARRGGERAAGNPSGGFALLKPAYTGRMAQGEPKSSSPFWRFSLQFYRQEGVAEACIALQEESGADVNLLLFLLWHAARRRRLAPAQIAAIERRIAPWRDMAVTPLRAIRRALKSPQALVEAGAAEALRTRVKAVELEAERLQQEAMHDLVRAGLLGVEAPSVAEAASANLAAYGRMCRAAFAPSEVGTILAALAQAHSKSE